MGIFRFILAIMVALSHAGIYFYGFNQGVIAVAIFFILSGYTTDIVLEKYDLQSGKSICKFYVEKIKRLFPEYIVYTLATLLFVWAFQLNHETIRQITLGKIVLNLLMFPLAYNELFSNILDCIVIPAAWTLGLQCTYYILSPFITKIIKKNKIIGIIMYSLSFFAFIMSTFGILNGHFSYSYISGSLWLFLLGISIRSDNDKWLTYAGIILSGIPFLYIGKTGNCALMFNKEILLGVLFGIPMISFLMIFPRGKIDTFLGHISYGILFKSFHH